MKALETHNRGFRWVLGNGENIVATKEQWLRTKNDFCVDDSNFYSGRHEKVSTIFYLILTGGILLW